MSDLMQLMPIDYIMECQVTLKKEKRVQEFLWCPKRTVNNLQTLLKRTQSKWFKVMLMIYSSYLRERWNDDKRSNKQWIRILLSKLRLTKWRGQLDHQINNCARDSRSLCTGSSKQQVGILREGKQSIDKVNEESYSLRSMKGHQV